VAEPIAGASDNGMSNTFPKVSPDGKWIVFVKCKNGQLMRPDGKLWIVPAAGGEARLMRCNTSLMNSWHSFSPNGRWMVFASKSNTPYTQLFLTHIDEDGNDSPAILIENSTAANRAANIPEFINIDYEDLVSITVPDVDLYRHMHRANVLAGEGRYLEAIAAYEQALEVGSDSRVHGEMAKVLMNLGEGDRALQHLELSRELNPNNYEVFNNLAKVLFEKGRYLEAREHLDAAIQLFPNQPRAWSNRARVAVALQEEERAIADFTHAIEMAPRFPDAYRGRGMVLEGRGEYGRALKDLDRAIRLDPDAPDAWYFRAVVRAKTGNPGGAVADLDRALKVASDSRQVSEIESLKQRILVARGIISAP
jgi:tetratricopeptide (TPR) repeat protein